LEDVAVIGWNEGILISFLLLFVVLFDLSSNSRRISKVWMEEMTLIKTCWKTSTMPSS